MLIIEGPDLVGKTTFCNVLLRKLNALGWPHVYRHFSRLPVAWGERWRENYLDHAATYAVQDRYHLSEPLYAKARCESSVIKDYSSLNTELLRRRTAFTVVVTAVDDLIKERYARLAEREMFSLDKVLDANNAFFDAAVMQVLPSGEVVERLVDHHIHCGPEHDFPTERDADEILRLYLPQLLNYPKARIA